MSDKRNKIVLFRVVVTAALLFCIAFIFCNSTDNATQSEIKSGQILLQINACLQKMGLLPVSEHFVRKLAHFLEYALEGFLLFWTAQAYGVCRMKAFGWFVLAGVLTAMCDESIQMWSAGRSAQLTDVWLDTSGVIFGMCFGLICVRLFVVLAKSNVQCHHNDKSDSKSDGSHIRM